MKPRALIATIAVLVVTSLFALFMAPMLTLVPSGTVYAQEEGPSIEIEFSPHYMVRDNEELDFTLTFSGITSETGLTYDVNVATFGEPDVPECEGTGTGEGMTLGSFSGDTASATGTIPAACPPHHTYALVVKLFDSSDDELITVASPFKISPFMKLVLPGETKPESPAGLRSEVLDDHTLRFHVVDSATSKVYVYDLRNTDNGFRADSLDFVETYDLPGASNPWGITSDASTTWVTNDGAGSGDKVFAYSNEDRNARVNDDEFTLVPANSAPRGLEEYQINDDFRLKYVVDNAANKVFYYSRDRDFGSSTSTFTHVPDRDYILDDENTDPTGLWLTGWLMYVSDNEDDKVFAYEMAHEEGTGKAVRMPVYDVDDLDRVGNSDPAGITADWRFVYVLDSVDQAIYAYEYPETPFQPVTIHGKSEIRIPENSTTTGETYDATDPNPDTNSGATNTRAYIGLFRTLTDDRIFDLVHLGSDIPRVIEDFELVFRKSYRGYYEDPNFEDPKDADKDNVYELIIRGGSRGFPHAYFPVRVTIEDVQPEPPYFREKPTTREVAETTPPGRLIRPPVEAVNPDNEDTHIYSLGGTDADSFDISTSTGHIITKEPLDASSTSTYSVTVSIRDNEGETASSTSTDIDDTVEVTIIVFEGPEINGPTQFNFAENGTGDVTQFTASNPGDGTLEWSLGGDDAGDFTINESDGTLRFATPPDYENETDADTDNVYEITVVAKEGSLRGDLQVTVTVTDENDAPVFSDGSSTSRNVDEGSQASRPVGAPVTAADQDTSDTLTYSLSGTDASSFDIDSSTGQIKTKDALDFDGGKRTYEVTVEVRDSRDVDGAADTATDDTIDVAINVQDVNDPPVLTGSSTVDYLENGNGPVATYTATDPENQPINWGLSGDDEDAFSISNGVLSFVTPPDYDDGSTSYSVTVEASDGNSTSTLSVTVNIEDVDETPVVTGEIAPEFAENGQGTVATYDDGDPEQGNITWSLSGDDTDDMNISNGDLTFNSAPDHEHQETYNVTVQAFDGNSTGTLAVVVTVTDVNEDPEFPDTSTTRTIEENKGPNAPVGLPVKAEDPDVGDTLTYLLSGTDATSFTIDSNGQIKAISSLDRDTKDTYSVTVEVHDGKDANGDTSTTTDDYIDVTITVTDVNEPPVLTGSTSVELAENSTTTVATYTAADPERVTPTWDLSGDDKDDFEITGGVLTFKSLPDREGATDTNTDNVYHVTVEASDGNHIARLQVTITVTNVNEKPQFPTTETRQRSVEENTASGQNIGVPVAADDPEGDSLTYTLSGTDAASFNINSSTGQILTKDALDEDTKPTYDVTVEVHDGKADDGSISTTTDSSIPVTITVTGINEPPVVTGTTTTEYAENGNAVVEDYDYDDQEGDPITWSLSGVDEDDFTITQTGEFEFASSPDYEAPADSGGNNVYNVNVLAADGTSTTTHAVTVTVTNVNEQPAFPDAENGERSVPENTAAGQNIGDAVSATDPEDDDLTYILDSAGAEFFGIDESTGQLKTKADLNAEGQNTYSFYVDVHDGKDADGNTATSSDDHKQVTITVNDVNEVPVVTGTTTTTYTENGTGDVATYTADDPENDDISWSPAGTDTNAFTISEFGVLSFANPPDFEAQEEYSVIVTASDGKLPGTLPVTITITDVNEPPDVTGRTAITFVETATGPVETFDARDPEERTITWEVLGTDKDAFTITNGALNFAATPNYEDGGDNTYEITIKATDDAGQSDELDVTVIVTDQNEVPEFPGATTSRDISENTAPNQNVGSPVTADDPENDRLTYSLTAGDTQHFDISTSTGQILTKGDLDYESSKKSYTVTVQVTDNKNADGDADSTIDDTIAVTINVVDEDEGPEITSGATTTSWNENETGTVASYIAIDPEGATTTWTVHGTDAADFSISDDGELNIDSAPDYEHKSYYQVTVRVSDAENGGNIVELDVTINVTNLDEPGVVTLPPSSPEVGTPINAGVTDPDRIESAITWSWHRSQNKSNWTLISDETASGYTPVNADEDNYLRATASYTDGHGPNKTASSVSDSQVPTTNSQPSFSPSTTRSVDENTEAGQPIGDPVAATERKQGDTLVYELGGDDADMFGFSTSTGQLSTKQPLDFEGEKNSYTVTVSVSDGKNVNNGVDTSTDDTITVTVNVKNVNEPPGLTGSATVEFDENATDTVAIYTTDDPEGHSISWDMSGTDSSAFDITTGTLTFKSPPDFETKPTYQVTVEATDGPNTDTLEVTVNINNLEEPGAVTLSSLHPTVEAQLTATLADPDGSVSEITWTWETATSTVRTATSSSNASDSYTPTAADEGKSLRVSASYTDPQGSGKSAQVTAADPIAPKPITNDAPVYTVPTDTRSVDENTDAGQAVGAPVTAMDDDPQDAGKLTYTLGGTNASSFDIESTTGQILTKAALNREAKDTYTVTVTATDTSGEEDTVTVTITVTDVDEEPEFTSGPTSVSYAETATGPVATYTAVDPEGGQVVWDKTGDDGTHFSVINGVLTFNAQPDHDIPRDDGNDNVYHVTVLAKVRNSSSTASLPVTVTVTPKNEPPQFPHGDTGTRSVTENTTAGQNVGAPVSASDPEKDTLFYWLSGRDARSFDISTSTGQILAKAALNFESKHSYSVRVSVRDNKNVDGNTDTTIDDTIDITITVVDENEAPEITGASSTNFAENGTRAVASYTGRDPEGASVSWTVLSTDSAYFAITNSGVLSFDPAPDYEDPMDSDRNNVYHVTVQASDGNNINRLDMTVTVTNVEEAGTVGLSSVQPQVDTLLTATLDDPDDVVSAISWSWQRSRANSRSSWSTISNATSDSYTSVAGDVGRYLRATARYDDGYSNGKSASTISENTVRTVPQNNNPPRFLSQFTTRTVDENTGAGENVGEPVEAVDDPNDNLTYRLDGTNAGMFSIVRSTGQIQTRMPLDHETTPSYSVTVKAFDPSNASSTIPVTISVTDVNEPPVTVDDVATTTEDGSAVIVDVLANDSDPDDGDTITLVSTTQPTNGTSAIEQGMVKYTPNAGYYGSDQFTYTVSDGTLSSVGNVSVLVDADDDLTVQNAVIPMQFVPIDGGGERILLSDYFSDPDEGHPPYQATTSDATIATVEVSEGYLTITPVGIGVATTTLTVSDTPGINQEFRVVVYRPVVERTDTETVHIVDPSVETTLVSENEVLSVIFQAGARDQFFQAAIDAQSNNCGVEAPIGHQHVCVLVDLFDLGAQSIEESLNLPSTLHVDLDQTLYSAVQTAISNGEFQMWKGHGPTDVSWDQVPQCPDPRGTAECYSIDADPNGGGTITVFNIEGFSEFAAGSDQPAPPPTEPPTTTPPPDNTGGGGSSGGGSGSSGGSSGSGSGSSNNRQRDRYEYPGNQTPQIFGQTNVTFSENGTDPVATYIAEDADDDELTWSLLGYDKSKFSISQDGVLSFRSPPDYENPEGREGNTYWVIIQADDDGRPSEYDVHNVRVTVTQVNELGELIGDAELSVPEGHTGTISQYQVDDPEKGVITWTLSGPDAATFEIDVQGNLVPAGVLDFETPSTSSENNVHTLTITVTDDGEPEESAQLDVTLTISNVNEAPRVGEIPDVDLSTRHLPWMLDLAEFFTDPDGDSLSYEISGRTSTDVAHAAVDSGTLSITPAGKGITSFYVVAADSGGLSVIGKVAVSVTEPEPAPTPAPVKVTAPVPTSPPAPVKVTAPVPTSTPAPAVVVETVPAPTPEPVVAAPEPSPPYEPLSLLSERRWRNLAQQPDAVSKVIVAFAIEPVDEPMAEVTPPLMETPVPPKYVSLMDDIAAGNGPWQPKAAPDGGGGLSVWLIMLLVLIAMVTAGYSVRMYVIHRL